MDNVKPRGSSFFMELNRAVVHEFRTSGGIVGGPCEGMDILLLTTVGARSGLPRLSPLVYFAIDDRVHIAGSYDGNDVNPAWVHNLRADPRAHIDVGMDSYDVIVREVPRPERDAIYSKIVEVQPGFGVFEARTERVIPVFELRRNVSTGDS